jgi:hypothetical protein
MVEKGMKWEQIRLVSVGDSDRLTQRFTGRDAERRNQRVEIVVTQRAMPADPFSKGGAGTPGSTDAGGGGGGGEK